MSAAAILVMFLIAIAGARIYDSSRDIYYKTLGGMITAIAVFCLIGLFVELWSMP
jgi:hypothetical protein